MVRTQQSLCSQFLFNPPKDKRSYHLNIHLPCQPPSFVNMLKQQLRFSFQIHLASSRFLVTIECFSGAITTVLWLFLQEEQHHVPVAWCRTRRGISYLNHLHDSKCVLLCVWLRWFFWWWWSFTYTWAVRIKLYMNVFPHVLTYHLNSMTWPLQHWCVVCL